MPMTCSSFLQTNTAPRNCARYGDILSFIYQEGQKQRINKQGIKYIAKQEK